MIYLYIAAGGAMGAAGRYAAVSLVGKWLGMTFPYGTLGVNILGSLLMGILIGMGAHYLSMTQEMRAFLAVGLLGGFTTFSAFSLDAVTLYERGEVAHALLYVLASVLLSLLALFAGLWLTRP